MIMENDVTKMIPAELAIVTAISVVVNMGDDALLSEALILLRQARAKVVECSNSRGF